MKTVTVGCGQGFWGDSFYAPLELVGSPESGTPPLDYLVLDYLAEVTMSILSKQREKNSEAGFARDFVGLVAKLVPALVARKTKVIANAGGVNPMACAKAIREAAAKTPGGATLKIACVEGDDIIARLDELMAAGESFEHLETRRPFSEIRSRVQSANVYLGAEPIVEALRQGADIVVTGRVADPALVLAPLLAELGWEADDWDRRAAGIVAGHIIECGAQASGGNCSADWRSIPSLATVGYPIIEAAEDGSFFVTKQPGTGGRVDSRSVKEQLIYEIGDPRRYVTPDVVADFTSLSIADAGHDRVRITGVRGAARPDRLKVSVSYANGFLSSGTLLYSWPDAYEKARAAGEIVRARLAAHGVKLQRLNIEHIGANACHGDIVPEEARRAAEEVLLRVAAWDLDRSMVERFTRELTPLVLNGPPHATSYFAAKGAVQEVFAYWPTLIARDKVNANVSILNEGGA